MSERTSSVDPQEVERFARLAARWWDPRGPMAPLHKLNPVRLAYIRDNTAEHFGRDAKKLGCLKGLRILDIGCGAGILSEPLARLGAEMTGIDPAGENIAAARAHAVDAGITVDYRATTAEELAGAGEQFDVVLALEIVEHVADLGAFLAAATALLKPGGALVAATLNRTAKSYLFAIVGAEYVLGWLPRGTHDWRKFVRPSELAAALRRNRLRAVEIAGVSYNPLADRWSLTADLDVNYMVLALR